MPPWPKHLPVDISIAVVLRRIASLSDCEWRTALQLRLVSRLWFFAVTSVMVGSLTFTASNEDETMVEVKSRNMKLPPLLRRIHPECWVNWHPGHLFTAFTFVVSVVGFFPAACNLRLLQKALPHIEVLRMCPDMNGSAFLPYVPFKAPVTVFFPRTQDEYGDTDPSRQKRLVKLPSLRPRMHHLLWARVKAQGLLPHHPKQLSPTVSRIVINTLNLRQSVDLGKMYNLPQMLPKHVKEVVIVVPCYLNLQHTVTRAWNTVAASANLAALLLLSSHAQYTIVGLDEIRIDRCESQLRSLLFNDLWHQLKQRSQAQAAPVAKASMQDVAMLYVQVTEILSRVRTVSLKEFVRMNGMSGREQAMTLFELTFHWGMWFEDSMREMKQRQARQLRRFPNFSVVPEDSCPADRLFGYVAENGLF